MVNITSNFEGIHKKTDLDVQNTMLYVHMNLDTPHSTAPLLVEKGEEKFLLVKDIERGNFDEEKISAEVKYYNKYMTFDTDDKVLPSDWLEICEEIAGNDVVEIDDDIYTSAYWKLSKALNSKLKKTGNWFRTFVYELNREDVQRAFAVGGEAGCQDALKLISHLKQEREIAELLGNQPVDSRFTLLDDFLRDADLDALLISSPLNMQEITGLPYEYCKLNDLLVMYCPKGSIWVWSNRPIDYPWFRLKKIYQEIYELSRKSEVREFDAIGIEEDHLPYKYFQALGLTGKKVVGMSMDLRRWREVRASEELSFYVVAAQATISGIDAALEFAQEQFNAGNVLTESDVQSRLYSHYAQYSLDHNLQVRIVPYFIVLHAGYRTRRPNLPSFEPLNKEHTKTMKLDCGVLIIDQKGLVRACSDLCRTLARNPEAKQMYQYLNQTMITNAIPAALPGKTGKEVYHAGVFAMLDSDDHKWVDMGLLPQRGLEGKFERDIGHVLGKQEPVSLGFKKGDNGVLRNGMVCCVEYQWPYDRYAIGVEDMFVVTSKGPVNLTR